MKKLGLPCLAIPDLFLSEKIIGSILPQAISAPPGLVKSQRHVPLSQRQTNFTSPGGALIA